MYKLSYWNEKRVTTITDKKIVVKQEQAKKNIVKSHIYLMAAWLLLLVGILYLVSFYIDNINGNPSIILQRPILLFKLLVPIFPALVFFLLLIIHLIPNQHTEPKLFLDHQFPDKLDG